MKVAIITSGYFPVPATKGGAVESLDEHLILQNEIYKKINFTIFSCYDENAKNKANEFKSSKFEFINIPFIIRMIDIIIYNFFKKVLRKKKHMSYRYIMQRLYYIDCVAKRICEDDYDKILIENHSSLFLILKKYNNYKKYTGKYYYHLHNIVSNDYGCKDIICGCKRILGVSNYINTTLLNFLNDSGSKLEYSVLRNKVDEKKFIACSYEEKLELRKRFNINNDDKIVLFTGRLNQEKGIKELLLAFKDLKNKNAKLLVVGSYYYDSKMKSGFEFELRKIAMSISDRIIFTGYIDYVEIPKIYSISDIVVIPSLWDDPAPLTVIESIMAGKPLITTYSGGIPEYVSEDIAIILKRDENLTYNLTKSIDKFLNNELLLLQYSNKAKAIAKNWTLKSYYEDFLKLID